MDKIKEKIQSLCPDVMELKFGCEVSFFYQTNWRNHELTADYEIEVVTFVGRNHEGKNLYTTSDGEAYAFNEANMKGYKILGSPITLAVTLRALAKVGTVTKGANALINIIDVNAPDIRWKLDRDNWDEQSVETKEYIGTLLGIV